MPTKGEKETLNILIVCGLNVFNLDCGNFKIDYFKHEMKLLTRNGLLIASLKFCETTESFRNWVKTISRKLFCIEKLMQDCR